MPKYGIVKGESIVTSSKKLEGYKPIEYADIPDGFDETTHYVLQLKPAEEESRIYIGNEVNQLDIEEDEDGGEGVF